MPTVPSHSCRVFSGSSCSSRSLFSISRSSFQALGTHCSLALPFVSKLLLEYDNNLIHSHTSNA